jgi:hypothetical protein
MRWEKDAALTIGSYANENLHFYHQKYSDRHCYFETR